MHERKPIIAITPLLNKEQTNLWMLKGYHDMLMAANALPLDLPLGLNRTDAKEFLGKCDGLLIVDGPDVNPALYHQACLPGYDQIYPARDKMDRMLLSIALAADMPILGISRGMHLLNVHLGGTLFQDLSIQHPSGVNHNMQAPYNRVQHMVEVEPDSPLAAAVGTGTWGVNSRHHQAIRKLARSLNPMAISEDGLIEAVYCPHNTFVWAVQWHPDLRWEEDERQRHLCQTFTDQAWLYRKRENQALHDP